MKNLLDLPLLIACRLMFHLNHYAARQECDDKQYIYALKSRLVQLLYETGHCTAAQLKLQTQPCLGYGFRGCEGATCQKCGGTGIYSQHSLYAFAFSVCRQRFAWHQPLSIVPYDVTLSDSSMGDYQAPKEPKPVHLDQRTADLASVLVWFILAIYRRAPEPPPVLLAFKPDFRWVKQEKIFGLKVYIPLLFVSLSATNKVPLRPFNTPLPGVLSFNLYWPHVRRKHLWSQPWVTVGWFAGAHLTIGPDWLRFGWKIHSAPVLTLAGLTLDALARLALNRLVCLLKGHDVQQESSWLKYCNRCGAELQADSDGQEGATDD